MKIDRLMGIVVYLLNHGRTSAQRLAEEFEVSSRTIVRDLEALDRAGIPIQSFYGVATEDTKINQQLTLLEDAIEKQYMVRFSYTNSHDEVKELLVEPVQLYGEE